MDLSVQSKKKKRKTARTSASENDSLKPIVQNSLKGLAAGLASALPLLLIMSAVAYRTPDPASLVSLLSYVALLFGAFAAGFASAKINQNNGMLCGIITGAVYLIFVFLVSLFLHNSSNTDTSFILSLGLRSIVILASVLGGCLGEKKEKKARRHKRH